MNKGLLLARVPPISNLVPEPSGKRAPAMTTARATAKASAKSSANTTD